MFSSSYDDSCAASHQSINLTRAQRFEDNPLLIQRGKRFRSEAREDVIPVSLRSLFGIVCLVHLAFQDLNTLDRINNLNKGILHNLTSLEGNACRPATEYHRRLSCKVWVLCVIPNHRVHYPNIVRITYRKPSVDCVVAQGAMMKHYVPTALNRRERLIAVADQAA